MPHWSLDDLCESAEVGNKNMALSILATLASRSTPCSRRFVLSGWAVVWWRTIAELLGLLFFRVFERWAFSSQKTQNFSQFDGQFTVQVTLPPKQGLVLVPNPRTKGTLRGERSHIPLPFWHFWVDDFPFYQGGMRFFPVWVLVSCLKPRHLNQPTVSLSCTCRRDLYGEPTLHMGNVWAPGPRK